MTQKGRMRVAQHAVLGVASTVPSGLNLTLCTVFRSLFSRAVSNLTKMAKAQFSF